MLHFSDEVLDLLQTEDSWWWGKPVAHFSVTDVCSRLRTGKQRVYTAMRKLADAGEVVCVAPAVKPHINRRGRVAPGYAARWCAADRTHECGSIRRDER